MNRQLATFDDIEYEIDCVINVKNITKIISSYFVKCNEILTTHCNYIADKSYEWKDGIMIHCCYTHRIVCMSSQCICVADKMRILPEYDDMGLLHTFFAFYCENHHKKSLTMTKSEEIKQMNIVR